MVAALAAGLIWATLRNLSNSVAQPLPPVQRPGTSQPKGAAQEAVIQNLTKKLDASGSLKDAAALLKARRASR